MDAFEFLGGRYNRPEQIMSGPVQAFRAQNAATGKTVFIHRVSTTEAPAEQAALLKLMTTALVKSADAKRLVLDFGEERGYWYVVTESEPQCALLREWLQLEIEAALAPAGSPSTATPKTPRPTPREQPDPGEFTRFLQARTPANPHSPAVPPTPAPGSEDVPNPGEFTRMFTSQNPPQEPLSPPQPHMPAPPPVSDPRPAPGEFTGFFNASEAERKHPHSAPSQPPRPPTPPPSFPAPHLPPAGGPTPQEPGEFTRYFTPGLPSSPPKPPPMPPGASRVERTHKPFVQRPDTPVILPPSAPPKQAPGEFTMMFSNQEKPGATVYSDPPDPHNLPSDKSNAHSDLFDKLVGLPIDSPSKPAELKPAEGEFTQMFSNPGKPAAPVAGYRPSPPVRSDPLGFAKQPSNQPKDLSDELFDNRINLPSPTPPSKPAQGEFTRMFGPSGVTPPPVAPQGVLAPPRDKPLLDEDASKLTQPFQLPQPTSAPPASSPPVHSPSEFTRMIQGYGPAQTPSAPAGPAPQAGGASSPLLNVNVSPVAPAALPHVPPLPHVGGASSSFGSANISSPRLSGAQLHAPPANLHVPPANLQVPPPKLKGANNKLLILFVVLGVLAIALVVLMVFLVKNK